MPKKTLTNEQDTYLRSIALGKSVQECTTMLNERFGTSFKIGQIRAYKSNHQIKSGCKPWEFVDHSKQKITTPDQDIFIHENFKGIGNKELADRVNKKFGTSFTSTQMDAYKGRHKLNSGLTGQFQKGAIPANKGKKFPGQTNRTTFRKGNISPNTDPIGTEKELKDGYIWVKVNNILRAPKNVNWKQKQRLIWEQHHGLIPKGYIVIFADGNMRNFDIHNLVLATRAEVLYLNRHHMIYNNADFTKSAVLVARLETKVNSIKRNINQNDEKEIKYGK